MTTAKKLRNYSEWAGCPPVLEIAADMLVLQAILKHALGAGRGSPGWRNHFCTGPGSDDYADCEALVAAGLMSKRSGGPLSGGDLIYRVTDAGQDALVGRKTPNAVLSGGEAVRSKT